MLSVFRLAFVLDAISRPSHGGNGRALCADTPSFFSPSVVRIKTQGAVIIDGGCGLGDSTADLKKAFPQCKIIGVDKDTAKLQVARKLYPRITFVWDDLENTLLPPNMASLFVFRDISDEVDLERVLKNSARVLHDDGAILLAEPKTKKITTFNTHIISVGEYHHYWIPKHSILMNL